MKKLALLPFLIAGLHGQETHKTPILPPPLRSKGGFKALPPKANS